jgi:Na+/H+ antiporter NhaD/arsenite permease-like protein
LGAFLFPSNSIDLVGAVDFNVLILLSSIMVVNHLVVHLKETKILIQYFQNLLQKNGVQGFWVLSFISFIISPFLTNDGVCLLFVEPLLMAFAPNEESEATSNKPTVIEETHTGGENKEDQQEVSIMLTTTTKSTSRGIIAKTSDKLYRRDAFYFLLALACATNIGSSLTYTGNPQNMIVASDAIAIMPPYKFLIYMMAPATLTWFLSK